MATTIKDVAKHAGVSVSTVSLVINNSPVVKLGTRKKVLDIIKECGYKPNQNARSLVTKSTRVIGLIHMTDENTPSPYSFDSTIDTYMNEMIWSIESVAHRNNYSILLGWYNVLEPLNFPDLIDINKVDGIISVGGIITDEFITYLSKSGIPAVLVGARSPKVDYIDVDGEKAIFLTTGYLINKGFKKIVFINGTEISQQCERKMTGFTRAVENRGIKTWVLSCLFNGQAAYNAFAGVWETNDEKPDAVVCATDFMAVGVIRYLNDHGLGCPEDVSVIGFEDGLLAAYGVPALSTVHIHKDRLGAEACEILFNRFRNPKARRVGRIIEPSLVIRKSVGEKKR
jgi:DNA-binding LacI/PurR family transcriptional regulator